MEKPSNSFDLGAIKFAAFGDRVLVKQDNFRSGYECDTCHGSGKARCLNCEGKGRVGERQHKCSHCADGSVTCPTCHGKGGVLVVPETSQRKPTTGTVVSVGPDVKNLKVGDSVLFSSYAGYDVDLNRAGHQIILRILHEPEILCLVDGHLDLRQVRGGSDISTYLP